MNKPNLFLIGSMKSGTTTLHELLAAHPEICMSEPKEPCYFVDPLLLKEMWPEMWRMGFWRSEQSYLELFQGRPHAKYFGESSTDYSKLPKVSGVVERLHVHNPDARIIYIMRDPVERTISHYWHMVEHRGETRPPLEAITLDPHYMDVSHYAMQIQPYVSKFGRDSIHVLTFEALKNAPLATVQTVFEWLGVATNVEPEDLLSARNATPRQLAQKRAGAGMLDRLRHSRLWDGIGHYFPKQIRRLGVSMVERQVNRTEVDMENVVDYLRPIQLRQTEELAALVGREFGEWKTLYG